MARTTSPGQKKHVQLVSAAQTIITSKKYSTKLEQKEIPGKLVGNKGYRLYGLHVGPSRDTHTINSGLFLEDIK